MLKAFPFYNPKTHHDYLLTYSLFYTMYIIWINFKVYKDAAEKKSKEYKVKLDKWKSDMLKAGNAELFHKKPVPKSKAKKQIAKRKQTRKPKKLPTKKPLRKSLNLDPED